MKTIHISLITAILLLSAFLIPQTNSVRATGPLPTADDQKAYAHYSDDGQLWMNALPEDPESVERHSDTHINAGDSDRTYGFPLREGPNDNVTLLEPLSLDTSIKASGWFQIQFDTGPVTAYPSNVAIKLVSEGIVIGEDTAPTYSDNAESYQFNITLSKDTVNDLTLQITYIEHMGTTTVNIDLEGGTFVTLPIIPSTSDDDDADDDDTSDDDTGDDDSDDDTSDDDADDDSGGEEVDEKKESPGFTYTSTLFALMVVLVMIAYFHRRRNNRPGL